MTEKQNIYMNTEEDKGPRVIVTEVPRFDADDVEGYTTYLEQNGYVVISQVADQPKIDHCKDLFWKFIAETKLEAKRGQPQTWSSGKFPASPHNGIIAGFGIGQSEFCWEIRSLPKVKKVFSEIWKCNDLIVSFDGANAFRPWRDNPSWRTYGGWYHVDQNGIKRKGLQTVQGLVTLYDATCNTGGLIVIPKSHLQFEEICARHGCTPTSRDFVLIKEDDEILKELTPIFPLAKAGDLILWDSRCIHCNSPGIEPKKTVGILPEMLSRFFLPAENDIIRLVSYVCMVPRSKANEEVLEKRKTAFEKRITTTHWPQEFGISGIGNPIADQFQLTEEQKALI
eukprot:c21026_g1_i2.p1 GENE.c21026_g1_i2~~c21026_g1_i2.p1  ORF type:complete len:340 (-),score=155.69 c21026_g1_i2:115-1134(-)